jgi:outer membrane protein
VPNDDISEVVGRPAMNTLIVSILMLAAQLPTASSTISLDQAVAAAVTTHPQIRRMEADIDSAASRIKAESGSRLPKIQVSEAITHGNNPTYVFGSLLEQSRFGPENFAVSSLNDPNALTNLRSAITASISLFDGKRTSARIDQAREAKSQADRALLWTEQNMRFEVIRSYYGLLVARSAKEVADQAVRTAESNVKRVQDRLQVGLVVDSDFLAAQVELSGLRRQQIQAQGDVVTEEALLNTWMGLPIGASPQVSGTLTEKTFEIENQDVLIQRAIEHRYDYAISSSGVRNAEDRIREAKSDFYPTARAFASFGVSGRNFTSGSSDYIVGANITFDVFNAERKSRLSEARSSQTHAEAEQAERGNQIRLDVVRAVQQFRTARQQLEVAQNSVDQAGEVLRIIQDRYDSGITTITELLRAQTELVRARMGVLSSRHAYIVGYAAVLLATGDLTDVRPFS